MTLVPDESPSIGFLLVRVAEAIDRAFVDALAELDLKPRELRLLVILDRLGPLSQRSLANELAVDPGNLIEALDRLQARGLLDRPRASDDRRKRLVELTGSGKRLLRRATASAVEAEDRILSVLTPRERAAVHGAMLRVWSSWDRA